MDKKTFMDKSLQVKLLDSKAKYPTRLNAGSAGYCIYSNTDMIVSANSKSIIPSGIALTVPVGCYGRVTQLSEDFNLFSLYVGGCVVDRYYTGEIRVVVFNFNDKDCVISKGTKIAQLIVEQNKTPDIVIVNELTTEY